MENSKNLDLLIKTNQFKQYIEKQVEFQLNIQGINMTEFLVMHFLHEAVEHKLRRVDLAGQIGLTASGITRLLKPMEKIGLVKNSSNPRDARVSMVKLTKAGMENYKNALDGYNHVYDSMTQKLSASDVDNLKNLMLKLMTN